jgi:hypothetical protein
MTPIQPSELNASGLFPVSRHDDYAAALKACAATFRTAPLYSGDSFFLFVPRATWELSQVSRFLIFDCGKNSKLETRN